MLTASVIVPKISPVVVARTPLLNVEPGMGNFQDLLSKLVKQILNLEFVDISKLIPESWKSEEEHPACPVVSTPKLLAEAQSQIFFYGLNAIQH